MDLNQANKLIEELRAAHAALAPMAAVDIAVRTAQLKIGLCVNLVNKLRMELPVAIGDEPTIEWLGDTWRVIGRGAKRPNSIGHLEVGEFEEQYCHLASTKHGRQQRNGWCPSQICDWVPVSMLPEVTP